MTAIRVLVVEDDRDLNADLVFFLRSCGMTVEGSESAAQMERCLASATWDVVVLDLGLPDCDGLSLTQRLADDPDRGLVILTARGRLEDRLAGWESGAHVYLVKPVPLAEVAAVITAVHQRLNPAANGDRTDWRYRPLSRDLQAPDGAIVPLTHREGLLIERFADCNDNCIPRDQGQAQDTGGAMDSLVYRLRRKLKEHGDPIRTVYGVGYVFEGELTVVAE